MSKGQCGLQEHDLPALYQAADSNSLVAQRRYIRGTAANLLMLVLAAIAGAFVWKVHRTGNTDWAGVVACATFSIAVCLRFDILRSRPDKIWYDGRAAAESVKTLAWRYAVGGEPFRADTMSSAEADELLVERLREMLTDLKGIYLVPPSNGGEQVTSAMRDLRARSLPERRAAYAAGRIENQRDWYSSKARWNKSRADFWGAVLLLVEILGIVAAIFKAVGVLEIDLLALTSTIAAAGTSWLQTKQHSTLAEAYSIAAQELAAIDSRIALQHTEEDWARFMNDAEEAISREHTLWRASRG